MIVKEKQNLKPITHTTRHYKLYKDGKHLVTAGIASLSVIGVMAVSSEITVHADTNNNAKGAQQTATGGNAVTATTSGTSGQASTITQPVNVDHSQLNNAVDQARQAGLTVNQKPTTTQTVSQDQVDVAKQNIQNDETKQAQQIQTITRQHQTEVSNVNNFNGSKGDTSQLDAKVQEAQSVPGLTVVHDQDQTTVKKASDTQGIQEAVNNATQSNNDQAQSIQNAIDTQKQNYQQYQAQLNNLTKDHHEIGSNHQTNGGNMDVTISWDITWHYDLTSQNVIVTNAKVDVTPSEDYDHDQTGKPGFTDALMIVKPDTPLPNENTYYIAGSNLAENGNDDVPGMSPEVLWNKYSSVALAFYSQLGGVHGSGTIHYNTQTPYTAVKNNDGTYVLLKAFDRARGTGPQGTNQWGDAIFGHKQYPVWGEMFSPVTVSIPQLKTTETHYRYDKTLQ